MKIVEYAPEHSALLSAALSTVKFETPLLRSQAYLHHYFLSRPDCRLFLLLGEEGSVAATLGSERIRLDVGGNGYDAVVLSNTYSVREGAFAFLYLQWMKSAELGVMFPGNALLGNILAKQKRWHSVAGLRTYWLNWDFPSQAAEPRWKALLRPVVRRLARVDQASFGGRIAKLTNGELEVHEEGCFSDDMARRRGAFGFRLVPDVDYLNWRFSTSLDYVKYRVFRIVRRQVTTGYVALAVWPHCVIVSHCDGDDPEELALGVLLAISALNREETRYRKVLLTTMHSIMRSVFHRFGFRPNGSDTPFSIAPLGNNRIPIEPGPDWFVNMDLGDGGTMAGLVYRS